MTTSATPTPPAAPAFRPIVVDTTASTSLRDRLAAVEARQREIRVRIEANTRARSTTMAKRGHTLLAEAPADEIAEIGDQLRRLEDEHDALRDAVQLLEAEATELTTTIARAELEEYEAAADAALGILADVRREMRRRFGEAAAAMAEMGEEFRRARNQVMTLAGMADRHATQHGFQDGRPQRVPAHGITFGSPTLTEFFEAAERFARQARQE